MRYVGLDVHARQSTFCVLDDNGHKLKTETVHGPWNKVLFRLALVKNPFQVCFEASTGYGYLQERLRQIAGRVAVAHPGQLRLIFRSKRKNDRVDAQKLAKLLYLDEVPEVWVPAENVRSWRAMIEHRQKIVGERTRAKNQIRSLLRTHGIVMPKGLWTNRGMAWIEAQSFDAEFYALQRDILIERIVSLNKMLERVESALAKEAKKHAGIYLLQGIPGVGIRTAEAVVAYIDDPRRFARNKSVGSYFGLVPCQDSSAGKERLGHITRQGPATVRQLLTEAAWQAIRYSPEIRAYYQRIMQDSPERKKIAITATAHYLLRVMHAMLCTGELWRFAAA